MMIRLWFGGIRRRLVDRYRYSISPHVLSQKGGVVFGVFGDGRQDSLATWQSDKSILTDMHIYTGTYLVWSMSLCLACVRLSPKTATDRTRGSPHTHTHHPGQGDLGSALQTIDIFQHGTATTTTTANTES